MRGCAAVLLLEVKRFTAESLISWVLSLYWENILTKYVILRCLYYQLIGDEFIFPTLFSEVILICYWKFL